MKRVILKGSQITSKKALHNILKAELELPDYYGENLDALWDVLSEEIEDPLVIIWQDFHISKEFLGDYAEKVIKLFEDAKNEFQGFSYEIK
ncbi:MAG: barstar family protein [Deltaproteobacteria bacterium]